MIKHVHLLRRFNHTYVEP